MEHNHAMCRVSSTTVQLYHKLYISFPFLHLFFQVSFASTWIILKPPALQYEFEQSATSENDVELHVICNVDYKELITEIIVSGPMLLLACLFTFLARHLPDNNYEARTSAFLAYAALMIAIAFNLTYMYMYIAVKDPYGQLFYRYLGITLLPILFMFCVYLTRLYTVYFVSDMSFDKTIVDRRASGTWRLRSRTTSSTIPITKNRRFGTGSSTESTPDGVTNGMPDVTFADSTKVYESTYL